MSRVFLFLFLYSFIFANEIDSLLKKIEINSDLSEKTKIANGGIYFIYKRSDLERMQINSLKDIIQTLPMVEYKESSYGFPDVFTYGDDKAFISNHIVLFINNQEIATGMYGSGFMMGDMNLDFVDHIEIYFQNPSYEYTTESTLILIKLYTKTAQKDNGGKVRFSYDIRSSKGGDVYYASQLNNGWSYFDYSSYYQNKRKKYQIEDATISRNHPTFQYISSLYNDNNHFLLQANVQHRDGFLDVSIDNTPKKSLVKSKFFHLGYDGNYNNFFILTDYDYKLTDSLFEDNVTAKDDYDDLYPIYYQKSQIEEHLLNTEFKYKYQNAKNTLISGVKYRYKWFGYNTLIRNDTNLPSTGNTNQRVLSIFMENQYSIKNNSILNLGIMKANIHNNNSDQQDSILNYRIAHTHTTREFILKSIYAHTEFSIDPYLVNSTGFFIKDNVVKVIKNDALQENISYSIADNKFDFLFTYSIFRNYLVPDITDRYLLYNTDQDINSYDFFLSFKRKYNDFDKIFISMEYLFYKAPLINKVKKFKSVFRDIKTFQKYDVFNEFIFTYVNDDTKYYLVYNLGVKYHYCNDLVISLKGENIFNKAYKQYYLRADPDSLEPLPPTQISPVDRNFIFSLEYYF